MTEAAPRRWTVEEFFAWQETQPERYELVDGFPIRMMAGAKNVHRFANEQPADERIRQAKVAHTIW